MMLAHGDLHWLPIGLWVEFKVLAMPYKSLRVCLRGKKYLATVSLRVQVYRLRRECYKLKIAI